MDKDLTVFVVDDDAQARASVVKMVAQRGLQAEAFSSVDDFLASYDVTRKGCIVLDIGISGMSGLELLRKLKSSKSSLPVVVTAQDGDVPLAVRAMQEGAVTFLEKPYSDDDLWQAITQAQEIEQTQHAQRKQRAEIEARLATLTDDESDVLRRLLAGHANKRIAQDRDLGLRTVELRRANIMRKMQAASIPDLVRM